MLASERPTLPEEVAAQVRGHFDDLSQWLSATLEEGARKRHFKLHSAPTTEALAFMAAIHGAMVSARAYDDPAVFTSISESLLARLAAR